MADDSLLWDSIFGVEKRTILALSRLKSEKNLSDAEVFEYVNDGLSSIVHYAGEAKRFKSYSAALEYEVKMLRDALNTILDAVQKDDPCIAGIRVVAYTALKGGAE